MAGFIHDQNWWSFFQNGYLRLGIVLPPDELRELQERINSIMLGEAPVDYNRMLMQLDSDSGSYSDAPVQSAGFKGPTLNYRKIQDLEHDPVFLAYMQKPLFKEICAQVYGAHAPVACYRAMFMNKPAGKGTVLPWHQDGGEGWGLDRDPLVTVWTALDPATTENGCVEVIPGSHRLGLLNKIGHTINAEQEQRYCTPDKITPLEVDAGEAFLLHNWLLHRSGVNRTSNPRRAFSVCYMDGRTRHGATGASFSIMFGEGAMRPKELQASSR